MASTSATPSFETPYQGNCVYTITFGEQAENHVNMQKIGDGLAPEGFTVEELISISQRYGGTVYPFEWGTEKAALLVIKNGVSLFGVSAEQLRKEQEALIYDTKAKMKGKVVNKIARHNICFDDTSQEPDYPNGKGRIISFWNLPCLNMIRHNLPVLCGEKGRNLKAEGNKYYNVSKCGIGFHGDTERKKVVAIRLGSPMILAYQWFLQCKPYGEMFKVILEDGDLYMMSEKATGWDWKRRKIPTLRHAAGCEKYLNLKSAK